MLLPSYRVALLLHHGIKGNDGKTGLALARYRQGEIVVAIDQDCTDPADHFRSLTGIDRDLPIAASLQDALAYDPDVLLIGIAPSGGALPPQWQAEIQQAIAAGLSIVNGLHTPMAEDPALTALLQPNQWIWDVRQEPASLSVGRGRARSLACKRILTVGTDMSVGKMSTSLELHRAAQASGLKSKFIGTGQAGIMISGDGVALDAVRVDFASGAVEQQVLKHGEDADIVFVEGQGSLIHPASTATLPLIRGSQPTHLILVHRAGQTTIRKFEDVPIPPLPAVIELYEAVARAGGAYAGAKVVGIALNTQHLSDIEAEGAIAQVQAETQLPCTDVVRFGPEPLWNVLS
ncbi:MAG: DUF1611 domain-containing protein [Synechococcales cyanobacterium RU_4_20]|nr:DUF1611 domain-containing protein [Synechococcales cyanobacterium RU_4_20]